MRVNVHVPDDLARRVKERLPDLNVSALVQQALRGMLECSHERVCCADCGDVVDPSGDALARFWKELLWSWEPLVDRQGTAEGAARVGKEVAVRLGVPDAERTPLPRPPRSKRMVA